MRTSIFQEAAGPISTSETVTSLIVMRVYCDNDAALRLEDGTPRHLQWIIEGNDGQLYGVPAEPGGWLRRKLYDGCLDKLQQVSAQEAVSIVWLTYADTDNLAASGYSFGQQDLWF
jgi:hypothetical protein